MPIGEEKKKFAVCLEAAQKDIECAFGVFQRKFQIMKNQLNRIFAT
jgi:Plant transposon protein